MSLRTPDLLFTAIAPAIWGSTYIVTTQYLPNFSPMTVAMLRALPAGLLLVMIVRQIPTGIWWMRIFILGALNISLFWMPKIQMLGDGDELNKGNERYPARQDTDIHEVSMVSAPHRSGPATSRRLDDWRLLGGSPTEPKEHQPQRNQYRHRRGVTDHGPRCVTV